MCRSIKNKNMPWTYLLLANLPRVQRTDVINAFRSQDCCINKSCSLPLQTLVSMCEEAGKYYQHGKKVRRGCNECTCGMDGTFACTERVCTRKCPGDLVWNECSSACPEYCGRSEDSVCTLQCVEACSCPLGQVREVESSTRCVHSTFCSVDRSCSENSDCPTTHWCRKVEGREASQCVRFVQEGEACEGYTLPHFMERCGPHLSCEARGSPLIADMQGRCTSVTENCLVEIRAEEWPVWPFSVAKLVRNYSYAESFSGTGSNWCNTCMCHEDGHHACTKMACAPCSARGNVAC